MSLSIGFVLCAVLTALFTVMLSRSGLAGRVIDQPSRPNTIHLNPVPRIGGVAIFASVFAVWLVMTKSSVTANDGIFISASLVLIAVSIVDDVRGLPPLLRLAAHLLVSVYVLWTFFPAAGAIIGWPNLPPPSASSPSEFPSVPLWLLAPGLVLIMMWSTNLYNFMDGADGMAGGMAVVGFGAYAIAAQSSETSGSVPISALSACIAGAALGFLFFNFSPAKVFMGDAGSIPLGFLAASLGILGVRSGLWAWWFPLLVFSPFIVDATYTLLKRLAQGKKIWLGHREHFYQRLILSGWNHFRVALSYYGLMLACATSALAALESTRMAGEKVSFTAPILGFWVVTYVILLGFFEWYLGRQR